MEDNKKYQTIEEKIANRLEGLLSERSRYIVEFDYNNITVKEYEGCEECDEKDGIIRYLQDDYDILEQEKEDLENEIEELKSLLGIEEDYE